MIKIRASAARGQADHGWLVARHSFSFGDYVDPNEMGWGVLRVINEDRVAPGKGFATHAHRDMEIITYVLAGSLEHRDSLGNGAVITPGEVQRMSAGSGIRHSEFNPSANEATHLLQIWIEPNQHGIAPSYEQRTLSPGQQQWRLLASADAEQGSVLIHQDVRLWAACLMPGTAKPLNYTLSAQRLAYVHLVRGRALLNGIELNSGDGAKITAESLLSFSLPETQAAPGAEALTTGTEILLFDLPATPGDTA
ncbi:MAG: pirin family protein [Pseudomonadota bacterium]